MKKTNKNTVVDLRKHQSHHIMIELNTLKVPKVVQYKENKVKVDKDKKKMTYAH